jgi:hypothetical protein
MQHLTPSRHRHKTAGWPRPALGDAVTGAAKKKTASKYERLHSLLGALGDGTISRDEFWRTMAEQRLTDSDIDDYYSGDISAKNPDGFLR